MKRRYIIAVLFLAIVINFCGTATAQDENATSNPIQENLTNITLNTIQTTETTTIEPFISNIQTVKSPNTETAQKETSNTQDCAQTESNTVQEENTDTVETTQDTINRTDTQSTDDIETSNNSNPDTTSQTNIVNSQQEVTDDSLNTLQITETVHEQDTAPFNECNENNLETQSSEINIQIQTNTEINTLDAPNQDLNTVDSLSQTKLIELDPVYFSTTGSTDDQATIQAEVDDQIVNTVPVVPPVVEPISDSTVVIGDVMVNVDDTVPVDPVVVDPVVVDPPVVEPIAETVETVDVQVNVDETVSTVTIDTTTVLPNEDILNNPVIDLSDGILLNSTIEEFIGTTISIQVEIHPIALIVSSETSNDLEIEETILIITEDYNFFMLQSEGNTTGEKTPNNPYKPISKVINDVIAIGTVAISSGNYNGNNRNITINENHTITCEIQSIIMIDTQGNGRIFTINPEVNVTNQNLTHVNRTTDNSTTYNRGTFNVSLSTYYSNTADPGIDVISNPTSRIQFSQVVGNAASMGEIYNISTLNTQNELWNSNNCPDATKITSADHYIKPGTYTVKIKTTDICGDIKTVTSQIRVLSASEATLLIQRYIQKLPPNAFNGSASKVKISSKFEDIDLKLMLENYEGAIIILKELKKRFDSSLIGSDNWIKDVNEQQSICKMIDDLVAYIQRLDCFF